MTLDLLVSGRTSRWYVFLSATCRATGQHQVVDFACVSAPSEIVDAQLTRWQVACQSADDGAEWARLWHQYNLPCPMPFAVTDTAATVSRSVGLCCCKIF